MGFRINTNIAAMNSHRNAMQTNAGLDKSLASLSSGLRINVAADDASGMTIADSLRSQAQGLGQAINNANDGVAVVQTADGALDEYINIINTVRTKSIQAASDGQNADSRGAIQADIDRLLEAADSIANTTQFNGQKLLDGTFTNKSFHIGAYAGETVDLSVGNVQTDSVGDISSVESSNGRTALTTADFTETKSGNILAEDHLKINNVDITSVINSNTPESLTDAANIASAITKATGIIAQGSNVLQGADIVGGTIDSTTSLEINGIAIADTVVAAGDADGSLAAAINAITSQTGVTAKTENGQLSLTSNDGSNISVAGQAAAQVDAYTLQGAVEAGDVFSIDITDSAATSPVTTTISYTVAATDTSLDDVTAGLAAAIASNATTAAIVTAAGSTDASGDLTLTAADSNVSFTSAVNGVTNRGDAGNAATVLTTTPPTTAVAQETTQRMSRDALSGDTISITVNGNAYTQAFDTDHATTMAGLETAIEAGENIDVTVTDRGMELIANPAGTAFTIGTDLGNDNGSGAGAVTTDTGGALAVTAVAQLATYDAGITAVAGDTISIEINGNTYSALFDTDVATTLGNLETDIEAGENISVTVDGPNDGIDLVADNAGEAFVVNTALTNDNGSGTGTADVATASAVTANTIGIAAGEVAVANTAGVAQVSTFAITAPTGGANAGDIYNLDLDGSNTLSYTAAEGDTEVEIATGLAALYNAGSTDGLALNAKMTIADDGAGTLTLTEVGGTAADGGNTVNFTAGTDAAPDLQTFVADTANSSAIGTTAYSITGLSDKVTNQTGTASVANLSSTATATHTIASGELIINGKDMAGVYGDGVNAGNASSQLLTSIQAINGMEDSSISSSGALTLVVNNGNDLNIAGTASATYGLTEGITNEAQQGKVQIFSDENVQVTGTDPDALGFTAGNYTPSANGLSLESIDVTNRDSAEVAILITDSALKQLDATRADLGSVQNQLESTIRNISVTQVNVTAAESQIRDVDFAAESANFAKLNILAQSGSYAMSQANAVQQNVMRLLQ